ncbi:MAG: Holo-[acyl-carrier-protein] synthase [Chlamydiae bacterium]|nr:Holo-[acyl-carrier-protein] synthase [Chlamydiota bacterium]
MIKGIGTDILEVLRFKKVLEKHSKRLIQRLFSVEEYEYCLKHKDATAHLAVRFSAKEAIAKALGCGFGKNLSFKDIVIDKEPNGRPTVKFSKRAMEKFQNPQVKVSMSHCQKYVTATAIWI